MEASRPAERICIVIPAYNEALNIGRVLSEMPAGLGEVLVVDDGSTDETATIASKYAVTLVKHEENRGKGAAIRTAINYVLARSFDAVVFLDADGQHLPSEIGRFVDCFATTRADLIIGSRMQKTTGMPLVRQLANRSSSWLVSRLAGTRVTDSQSGYRLLSTGFLRALEATVTGGFELESEMIIDACRLDMTYTEVPISCIYAGETSHYHPIRDSLSFLALAVRKLSGSRTRSRRS